MGLIKNILSVLAGRPSVEQAVDSNEQDSSWDPATSWYTSEEEELEEKKQEQVRETLEEVKISTGKRRVLFPGGLRLTLPTATLPVSFQQLLDSGNLKSKDRIVGLFAGSGLVVGQFGYVV